MTLAAISGKLAAHSWMACTSRWRYSAAFSSSLFCVFMISFFSTITTCMHVKTFWVSRQGLKQLFCDVKGCIPHSLAHVQGQVTGTFRALMTGGDTLACTGPFPWSLKGYSKTVQKAQILKAPRHHVIKIGLFDDWEPLEVEAQRHCQDCFSREHAACLRERSLPCCAEASPRQCCAD